MAEVPLLIVGGGPAGMAAARRVAAAGVAVTVVDEQQRPGGQILRQPPRGFDVAGWLPGRAYRALKAELAAFEAAPGIEWCGGRSVVGVEQAGAGYVATLAGIDGVRRVATRRVLIAAGCYDLPVPLPGWTLPGVMSAGGIQTLVKGQAIVPGARFVLAGTHPLMLVVADQLVAAGGEVALVAFEQPWTRMARALLARAATAAAHVPVLADAARALVALRRRGVAVRFGRPLREIEGEEAVAAAWFGQQRVACDRVGLCYGFVPQSDLPRMLGAAVDWAAPAGGWRTRRDAALRSDLPGVWIAGETGGVGGAAVALLEGERAALAILADMERPADPRATARLDARIARARRFADLLAALSDPRAVLARALPAETILCRCEDVRVGAVTTLLPDTCAPNAIKLATRCGMGRCQGRSCEPALLHLIAARGGGAPGAAGGFAARFPVRGVRIGDLVDAAGVAAGATISPEKSA